MTRYTTATPLQCNTMNVNSLITSWFSSCLSSHQILVWGRTVRKSSEKQRGGVKTLTLSNGRGIQVELLLCADSNRHHELWGGAQASGEASRTDEAEPIIDFMQENTLTSLLQSTLEIKTRVHHEPLSVADVAPQL